MAISLNRFNKGYRQASGYLLELGIDPEMLKVRRLACDSKADISDVIGKDLSYLARETVGSVQLAKWFKRGKDAEADVWYSDIDTLYVGIGSCQDKALYEIKLTDSDRKGITREQVKEGLNAQINLLFDALKDRVTDSRYVLDNIYKAA